MLFNLSLTYGFSKIHTIYSTLQVLYSPQDYQSEGTSASEWRSSTEVLFQPDNPKLECAVEEEVLGFGDGEGSLKKVEKGIWPSIRMEI
nr:hypothetical protein CFP56_67085 [Quercus suber]